MTKAAIKKAFKGLDPADQADVLQDLASTLAEALAGMDKQDASVFRARRKEERKASSLAEVKRRLAGGRRRK